VGGVSLSWLEFMTTGEYAIWADSAYTVEAGMERHGEIEMDATCACPTDQQMQLWSSEKSVTLSPGHGELSARRQMRPGISHSRPK
jgi:hypothetical protein